MNINNHIYKEKNYRIVNEPFGKFTVSYKQIRRYNIFERLVFLKPKEVEEWKKLSFDGGLAMRRFGTVIIPYPTATFDTISEAKVFIRWHKGDHTAHEE